MTPPVRSVTIFSFESSSGPVGSVSAPGPVVGSVPGTGSGCSGVVASGVVGDWGSCCGSDGG